MDLAKSLDQFLEPRFKLKNEYIVAIVSVIVILYVSAMSPKLPEFVAKISDNVLVKILMMFLLLWVTLKHSPSVSIIVAILVAVLMLALNLYNKSKETMMTIKSNHMESIPPYVFTGGCGQPGKPCAPAVPIQEGEKGEHGEKILADGPVSGVSDAEMESLCMHLKKDKNATNEIISESMFSELVNTEAACLFAKHQYQYDRPSVPCADPKNVLGKDVPFVEQATAGQW